MSISKKSKYYLHISIHGLIRSNNLELGRDVDTGGQTKYVVDLVQALAQHKNVSQVDLLTRRLVGENISDDYAQPIERINDKARIIRIDADTNEYLAKEKLWDHLDPFFDNVMSWINVQQRKPDVIHGHYADAGYVGLRLANLLGVPFIFTGHSLGRDKRLRLLTSGLSADEIEKIYNIERRINAEEEALASAEWVITSSHNEIEEQYSLYSYYDPNSMIVIPPGVDLSKFKKPSAKAKYPFIEKLKPFLSKPKKPIILALSRPDERKNIMTLIEVFGQSQELQAKANLVVIVGNREDVREMESSSQSVIINLLMLIDNYNLYGKIAIPKQHLSTEVPSIYSLVASQGGVFINPALTEPFGLTILEAAASGLPVVATENGGPVDIINNCKNGILVDPLDKEKITNALLHLLVDKSAWKKASNNGFRLVRQFYSWKEHTNNYLKRTAILKGKYKKLVDLPSINIKRKQSRVIVSGLDNILVGNKQALQEYIKLIKTHNQTTIFGIATGRRIDSALALMKKNSIPIPNIFISSLGTRIHYGKELNEDSQWAEHIDHQWNIRPIRKTLKNIDGLILQPNIELTPFKISYYYDGAIAPPIKELIDRLRAEEVTANVIFSYGQYLDIVPARASKGQALRYVAQKLNIAVENILVGCNSDSDEDMMRGNTLAVVPANHQVLDISPSANMNCIYFSKKTYAFALLDAIEYYGFFSNQ